MATLLQPTTTFPMIFHFAPIFQKMSEQDFYEFCQLNRHWKFERTPQGDLVVMTPTGGDSGRRNFRLIVLFGQWVEQDGTGIGFDSSTGFTLPNGAVRSPDIAWVKKSRWKKLSTQSREQFPPICPDFVVELRSNYDRLEPLQEKMQEYLQNGAQLGWLIDPFEKKVYLYQPKTEMRCLENPSTLSGEPLLKGFVLSLKEIWN